MTFQEFSDAFQEYRNSWDARAPNLERMENEDELLLLNNDDGVMEFPTSSNSDITIGTPPTKRNDTEAEKTKYLWVVGLENIPFVLEYGEACSKLSRKRASHTNLTGGLNAHCAGELWFKDKKTIFINGGSSRYRPRSSEELACIVRSFISAGYDVTCAGWDEELGREVRIFRV